MYYHRPRRNRKRSYLAPFIIVALILTGAFYAWQAITSNWINQNQNTINEKVFLSIENGGAKAMTVGKKEWQNAPDKIDLYRGEKIKTGSDGRVTLTYFDGSKLRLNTNSEATFLSLKRRGETYQLETELTSGEAWVNVSEISDSKSYFKFATNLFEINTKGATFAVKAPSDIYVLKGRIEATVLNNGKEVETYNVGVGQQLIIDEQGVQALQKGEETEVIFAMSDQFKNTNWYNWNTRKDEGLSTDNLVAESNEESDSSDPKSTSPTSEIKLSNDEEKTSTPNKSAEEVQPEESDKEIELLAISSPEKNSSTNKTSITISGTVDTKKVSEVQLNNEALEVSSAGKWSARVDIKKEIANKFTIKALDDLGGTLATESLSVSFDDNPPSQPVITNPKGDEDSTINTEETEQTIEGVVDNDVQAVIVNDYRLTQYVPGSGEFKYFANVAYNNFKVGKNEYLIIAEDAAGNQSEPTTLIINLEESAVDEAKAENTTNKDSEEVPVAQSEGGVKITNPNNGENFHTSETEHDIKGEVPNGTTKVTVNDYQLSQFKEGDTTFSYKAYASMKSLTIGEKNTYVVKAYTSNDQLIGQASITIDVESGDSAAPVITIPSAEANYSTNLDTVVIGGTIGKWVTRVYLNGSEIKEYIPGSEEFKKSFQLQPGKNTITIKAEKAGENAGEDTIEIEYTP